MMITTTLSQASAQDDAKAVAALDTEYQAAVKNNDAATMDRILADDFVLVTGSGKVYNKADLLKSSRDKDAVVRTSGGWRYVFGQASLPASQGVLILTRPLLPGRCRPALCRDNTAARAYFLLIYCRNPC
jgi:hypothetical protein